MKTLIVILVLFSSSLFAEIFNCTLTQFNDGVGGEMTYEALVDIGDKKSSVLSLSDIETGKSYDWITDLDSVGKIYFKKPNPFSMNKNTEYDLYITRSSSDYFNGIFFEREIGNEYPKIFFIEAYNEPTRIQIFDTWDTFGAVHKGTCD